MTQITDFSKDHAAGDHQEEIVTILEALGPCMVGHSRAVNVIALVRMIAVQLQPAAFETRKATIEAIPTTLHQILAGMDRFIS